MDLNVQIVADFEPGQRVYFERDPHRVGTVKYVGPLDGYSGVWVGVDWDGGDGKHDGTYKGIRYFEARTAHSGSFVRPQSLNSGVSFLEALHARYRDDSTNGEEDEMYVLSTSNQRVSVVLVGRDKIHDKLSRFDELTTVSLSFMGICGPGAVNEIKSTVPNLEELDLAGNLLSKWKDVEAICEQLNYLVSLNLSSNLMDRDISLTSQLRIRTLVLNNTGLSLTQVELIEHLLPRMEELHLMGNGICQIETKCSSFANEFKSLKILNLEENSIAEWDEVLKLASLERLEQLHLNKNKLTRIFYPKDETIRGLLTNNEVSERRFVPFQKLRVLLLGGNEINELESIDSLNSFPELVEIRLSENPVSDPAKGGAPRYVLIARLPKIEVLNGSEISSRERKESEIRYVRLVLSTSLQGDTIEQVHPRFVELKRMHCIEEEGLQAGAPGPRKMSSGLITMTLKCVGPTISQKQPVVKKLPATTTVGKLKILCENFFKLDGGKVKLKLFLEETVPFYCVRGYILLSCYVRGKWFECRDALCHLVLTMTLRRCWTSALPIIPPFSSMKLLPSPEYLSSQCFREAYFLLLLMWQTAHYPSTHLQPSI